VTQLAIHADDISKRFVRFTDQRNTLKERLIRGRAKKSQDFWALKNVSIEIPKGSVYGLIGHNGSGKSTMLKIMSGIYRPTSGSITTHGRLAALIELGAGFHPDMTGRENIKLNGSILGLTKKEITDATDEIIDFSGLKDFIDDPVKHYSSGMYVRLGFAVAVHMRPEILLVDEVLAVGDEEFQRKCFDHLSALRKAGKTIVVVSHGLGQLEGLCDEVTWLDHGVVQKTGPTTEIISAYLERVNTEESARSRQAIATRNEAETNSDSELVVTQAQILTPTGEPLNHTETGKSFAIKVNMRINQEILGPNVRIAFQHETGPLVTMVSNHRVKADFGVLGANDYAITTTITDNPLLPGRYRVHIDVFDYTGTRTLDTWNEVLEFPVRSASGEIGQGFVTIPATFEITPTNAP
jgi:ABC-2 type transport system ATP-binding protein/lipopolysaccharide transport system ATP-binding protein